MKKIRAELKLVVGVFLDIFMIIVFILVFATSRCDGIGEAIFVIVGSVLLLLFPVAGGIRDYLTHWIIYGNGSVTIRRVSKEYVNGYPVGKWKIREDTFLLSDIDIWGWSWAVLNLIPGHYLEKPRGEGRFRSEVLFQLKDGKRVCFELLFYARWQMNDFQKYIYEGTGLKFQM